jgi:DNA-binding NarL/FixJ family response regulator
MTPGPGSASSIRVVVADDQSLVRAGFRLILESEPGVAVVGEAEDGNAAVLTCLETDPDVVLMDIRMPELDGIGATRRLRDAGARARVLVLTTFDAEEYVYAALQAGASGFLLKTAPPDRLLDAIRQVHAGDSLLAPSITRRLIEDFVRRPAPGEASRAMLAALTEREIDVLRRIACGLNNQQIAADLFLSEATVKTHVNRIHSKLRVRDRAQAVIAAYESGLVRPGGS